MSLDGLQKIVSLLIVELSGFYGNVNKLIRSFPNTCYDNEELLLSLKIAKAQRDAVASLFVHSPILTLDFVTGLPLASHICSQTLLQSDCLWESFDVSLNMIF